MNNKAKIEKITSIINSKQAKMFDWILGISTFAYGVYSVLFNSCLASWLILFSGVIGIVLAYYRPSEIIQNALKRKMLAKHKS